MRTSSTTRKLIMATLGLGVAFGLALAPTSGLAGEGAVAFAAEGQGQQQPDARQQGQDTSGGERDPITGEKVSNTSVLQYINAIYVWMAFLGGLIAVISLIYAGYSYMASYGDPEKIANAKDVVEKTLIGLSLLILAALILNSINPRTIDNPCTPGEAGCGDIDFSKPRGGVPNN